MIIMDSFLGQHNPSNYFALTIQKDSKILLNVAKSNNKQRSGDIYVIICVRR